MAGNPEVYDLFKEERSALSRMFLKMLRQYLLRLQGTAALAYIENLPDKKKEQFKNDYKSELQNIFPGSPFFYPFKRMFISEKF